MFVPLHARTNFPFQLMQHFQTLNHYTVAHCTQCEPSPHFPLVARLTLRTAQLGVCVLASFWGFVGGE